jgi:GTP-binding protein HflX
LGFTSSLRKEGAEEALLNLDIPQGANGGDSSMVRTFLAAKAAAGGIDADLLLHVVDASNPGFPEQIQQVQKVLGEIGADDVPQILVFNKLDAIEPERQPAMLQDMYELDGTPVPRVFVSARSGQGLAQLRQMLADRVLQVREEAAREEVEGQDDTYWMSPDDDAQY